MDGSVFHAWLDYGSVLAVGRLLIPTLPISLELGLAAVLLLPSLITSSATTEPFLY